MEYYIYKGDDELYHWGIRGMKWGIRRYQNKDGSLTAAGKKKRASEVAKLKERERVIAGREKARANRAKLDAKKAELDAREKALRSKKPIAPQKTQDGSKPKTIKDLTDDELRAETNRMKLEKDYYEARKNLASANPRQVSRGERFINGLMNDVVVPAAKKVGKEYLEKQLMKKLGLDDKSAKSLLPEVKTWDDMQKKQTWEENNRKYEAQRKQEADANAAKQRKLADDAAANKHERTELDGLRKQLEKERRELEKKRKQLEKDRNKTNKGGS